MSVTVLAMNNAHLLLLKLKTNYVDFQHCDRWPNKHTVDDTCNHVTLDSPKRSYRHKNVSTSICPPSLQT